MNMEFMKTLAWSVIAPRQIEYSEDVLRTISNNIDNLNHMYPHLIITNPKIPNKN